LAATRYRISKLLSRGGMAEVLEAYVVTEGFERKVVIKRLLDDVSEDESFLRAFRDEARIAGQLHHANITGVTDFGVQDGLPFLVLEFVDGMDAAKLVHLAWTKGLRVPREIALHVATEIAHALDYAHQAEDSEGRRMNLVHRDVSPDNILVSWHGDVKLTDFGIAHALRRLERTKVGMVKGKHSYMAPEQLRGAPIDGRADIFALGCALHYLLTGRSARAKTTTAIDIDPGLENDLRSIIATATENDRSDRFPSARAMADVMGRALAKRLARDARSVLCEWLASVRPDAPSKGARSAPIGAFDVSLVLCEESGPLRRFSTASAGAIVTEAGETKRLTDVEMRSVAPHLAATVRMEWTRPAETQPPDGGSRTRSRRVIYGSIGAALAIALALAGVVIAGAPLIDERTKSEVGDTSRALSPVAASARPIEPPASPEDAPSEEARGTARPELARGGRPKSPRRASWDDLEHRIAGHLRARHLDLADLDHEPAAADLVAKWRRARLTKGSIEEGIEIAAALEAQIANVPISPAIVNAHLARLSERIRRGSGSLSADERVALERRFLGLQSKLIPSSSGADCERLLAETALLEDAPSLAP
jgi:serine/threonine protein kinase